MHTHREHTLTRSAFGGLACLAGIAVLLVALAAFLSTPAVAGAKVHSFTAVKVKKGVATFRLKHVSPRKIRSARVLGPKGTKKVSLKRIRRAARRGYLRVRVTRRGKHSLRVRSKRARRAASSEAHAAKKTDPTPPPTTTTAADDTPPPTTEPTPPPVDTPPHGPGAGDRDARSSDSTGDRRLHDGPEPARPRPVAAGMLATVRGHEPVQPADTGRCASHARLVVACRESALGGQRTEGRQGQHPRGRRLPQEHLLGPQHGPGVHRQGWLDDRTLRRRRPQGADAGRSTPDRWRRRPSGHRLQRRGVVLLPGVRGPDGEDDHRQLRATDLARGRWPQRSRDLGTLRLSRGSHPLPGVRGRPDQPRDLHERVDDRLELRLPGA